MMLNSKNVFKILLCINFIVYLLWFFFPFFWMDVYSYEIVKALNWSGYEAFLDATTRTIIAYSFFIIYIIAFIGVYFFKKWARNLFLITLIISISLTLFYGTYVAGIYEVMLAEILNISDGMLIAMMYFSNLKNNFKD
jgi:hypothetical protein